MTTIMDSSNHLRPRYRHDITCKTENRIDDFPNKIRPYSSEKANSFSQCTTNLSSTCFQDITRITAGIPSPQYTLQESLSQHQDSLVALSGGLDSFLIASLIHRTTGRWPPVATLVSHLANYCEVKETERVAKQIGITDLIIIEADEEDFLDSLAPAIKSMEVPLYNLHPVSKWVFANKIKQLGFNLCLTGDGADQIFDHDDGHDYLPLVGAIFADLEIDLICPLYRSDLLPIRSDSDKTFLRELAKDLLPQNFVWRKKRRRLAPFMDLKRFHKYPEGMNEKESTLYVTQHLLQITHS